MILKYNKFIDDLIFESLINETYVYYIKDFKDILYKLSTQSEIAKDLIDLEYRDVKNDLTFISLSDRDGYISGSTLRNLKNNIDKSFTEWAKKYLDDEQSKSILNTILDKIEKGETTQSDVNYLFNEHDLKNKSRNDVKLGRLVNALLPGKYTSKDIEEFTNKFKAALTKRGEYFEEVSGDAIDHWYNSENYKEMKGTLGNSCMAKKNGLFKIYTENPDVCKMLILVEDDKLIGRALVWKLNSIKIHGMEPEQTWFMDRQYTINDSDVEKFRNYAKEKGWIYKSNNNHHSFTNVTIEGRERNADLTVKVKVKDYKKYPYMDTFRRYDPNEGILYNDDSRDIENMGHYLLEQTNGGWDEVNNTVWSEWHDEYINEDDAVWSDWADSYLDSDRSIYVERGSGRGWYPESCDCLVYDEWLDESLHEDDAVWSIAYRYCLYKPNAVEVISRIDHDGEPLGAEDNWYHKDDEDIVGLDEYSEQTWFKVLSGKWDGWSDYDWVLRDLLELDWNQKPIPERFKLEVFGASEFDVEYLSEIDAEILGIDIDRESIRLTDKFEYEKSISSIREIIKSKLEDEIIRIKDISEDDISNDDRYKLMKYVSRFEEIDEDQFI
jgi:hypothetical protein